MQVNIQEFLEECNVSDPLYPGKRLIHKLPQSGEFKSHCVVYDWRVPDILRMEIKAGLSGRDMVPKDLKKYPVCFQSPTYVEFDTSDQAAENDNEDEEEEEGKSGGGGGRKQKKKKKKESLEAFSRVVEGKIPDLGDVKKMVVMGMDVAKTAFEAVLDIVVSQIKDKTVTPVNVLAQAKAMDVTVVTPSGGLEPKGNETANYQYKGEEMFGFKLE